MYQSLANFTLPNGFRGRSALVVQFWWIVQASIFRLSPQFAYRFRASILRFFGAKVGRNTKIRPTVKVTYPWKVSIGDYSWIGDDVVLYSLGEIDIGANSVVSQRSYLCAADHNYVDSTFPIQGAKISIGPEVWVAADVFIAPGISIGKAAVIGARSSVFSDMPEGMLCFGHPCAPVRPRIV